MRTLSEQNLNPAGPGGGRFASTRWTQVVEAGQHAREALECLCRSYWYPLYAYLRRHGQPAHEAQELTQGFFEFLLAGGGLSKARRERGRFRSFLLASLNHYAADVWDKERARKRGGGQPVLSLDEDRPEERYAREPADHADPVVLFEKKWALAVLEEALERLRTEFTLHARAGVFEQLGPLLQGEKPSITYAEAALRLGMTESAVKVVIHRMKRRFRELVREEVAHTVSRPEEVDDEMRYFYTVLGQ